MEWSLFLIPLLFVLFGHVSCTILPKGGCRCLTSDPCFPDAAQLAKLASVLSQPLLRPVPPESACYPIANPSGNCADVQAHTTDGIWRAAQPGSMQSPNFESYFYPNGTSSACYLNTTIGAPCQQGSVPTIGVDARTVGDVQAAVKFAKLYNLRVVVKGTGHDYLGRSTAKGAFLIWTHNIQELTYHDSFVPKGCPTAQKYQAMTIGAGVAWRQAFEAIQTHGRVLVGGACDTVGASGGWVQGGGHSLLSPSYGLGVDNVIEFSVVTSEGNFLVVNANSHPDLFWALRGGGGGTYAIVISTTYQTHSSTPVVGQAFYATIPSPTTYQKLVNEFVKLAPSFPAAGWGMFAVLGGSFMSITGIAPNITMAQANAIWDPFFSYAQSLQSEGVQISAATTVPFDSWYSWYKSGFLPPFLTGTPTELGTRLLATSLFVNNTQTVANTLGSIPGSLMVVGSGTVSKVGPDTTGLNPGWRGAIGQYVVGALWSEGASYAEIEGLRGFVRQSEQTLAGLDPDSGAYFNEASLYEQNPQKTFFGSHYSKLLAIKKIYDPSDMFVVPEGVGSDAWDPSLNCRL